MLKNSVFFIKFFLYIPYQQFLMLLSFIIVTGFMNIFRSSHLQVLFKICALKNFAIFWIKKRLQHRCFPWVLRNFYEQRFYRITPVWYGKTRVTSYELRVMSYELRVESLKARVEIQKCEFKSTSYEFKSRSYDFESTSYEFKSTTYELQSMSYEFNSSSCKFKSTSYEFKSTSYQFESTRTIKSMKTWINSFKISSFLRS